MVSSSSSSSTPMHHLMIMGSSAASAGGGLASGGHRDAEQGLRPERHVDYVETSIRPSCSAKSSKSLTLKVASGNWCARQHAAIQLSLAGRGRPRRLASAEILPHVREVASSEFSTTTRPSHSSRSSRVRGPQRGRPLPQLADGHERHAPCHARQPRGQWVTKRALDRP
jgi:hypothetical protein